MRRARIARTHAVLATPERAYIVLADRDVETKKLVFLCRAVGTKQWWEDPSGIDTSVNEPTGMADSPGFRKFLEAPKQEKLRTVLMQRHGDTSLDTLCTCTAWQDDSLRLWKPTDEDLQRAGLMKPKKQKRRSELRVGSPAKRPRTNGLTALVSPVDTLKRSIAQHESIRSRRMALLEKRKKEDEEWDHFQKQEKKRIKLLKDIELQQSRKNAHDKEYNRWEKRTASFADAYSKYTKHVSNFVDIMKDFKVEIETTTPGTLHKVLNGLREKQEEASYQLKIASHEKLKVSNKRIEIIDALKSMMEQVNSLK